MGAPMAHHMSFATALLGTPNACATRQLTLLVFTALQLSACSLSGRVWEKTPFIPETTYQKFLARAESGDAESQNLMGFMFFHGEGVAVDRARAEMWFRQAAAQGNARGRNNLAMMDSMGSAAQKDEPRRNPGVATMQGRPSGEELYGKFCAGCHGFNGVARYVHSPSFALGERLEKGDDELMRSLLHGKGEMPNWDNKLSLAELQDILRFVRTLRMRYEAGVRATLRDAPLLYYLFGPMRSSDEGIPQPVR